MARPEVVAALTLCGPVRPYWTEYLRTKVDAHGRRSLGPADEQILAAARVLEIHGIAMLARWPCGDRNIAHLMKTANWSSDRASRAHSGRTQGKPGSVFQS